MTLLEDTIRHMTPEQHELAGVWLYKDGGCNTIGAVARYDCLAQANGERQKQVRPFVIRGEEIVCRGFREPRPLYGLDLLAQRSDAPVLVVEGEKTADAAAKLFPDYVVVTSPHGAKAAHKAEWTPLAGRAVTIWPDNDLDGAGVRDYRSSACGWGRHRAGARQLPRKVGSR
jgi:Domain of unknown function (DUF6371)